MWSKYVFSKWNTFLIECNEGLFLDVNQKRRFSNKGCKIAAQKKKIVANLGLIIY